MTLLLLRKGFSLQRTPEGVGHLVDSRTGDALVLPGTDFEALSAAEKGGLAADAPGVAELVVSYGPFLVEGGAGAPRNFYELELEDAPTVPQIPRVAPVTAEAATLQHPAFEPPSAELELKEALTAAAAAPPTEEDSLPPLDLHPLEETLEAIPGEPLPLQEAPAGDAPGAPGQLLSQEDHLRLALDSQPTAPMNRAEVASLIVDAARSLEVPPVKPGPPAPPSSRRPVVLTFVGVTLLALGVAAAFLLRPGGDTAPLPTETPRPVPPVIAASTPTPVPEPRVAPAEPDAGVVEAVDAGQPVREEIDAGAPTPTPTVPDAGKEAPAVPEGAGLVAEVQTRGRVKMGEVTSPGEGELTWTVVEEQRVKAKQALGSVGGGDQAQPLTAATVGLVVLKQPTGAAVQRGAVLAEIIYFEAWAKALVRGATPTTAWRCEVVSATAGQRAPCKISVVAPKGAGAQVTVAIEPRWFDSAADAVLRLSPP